ncbi:MAG: amino acid adenylation domain-containing protein, partial [Phycisphaera sp.]|nr:amino acid adenylation domain-containing protein [Phycisphaera sp.]
MRPEPASDEDDRQQPAEVEILDSDLPRTASDRELAWLVGDEVGVPPSLPSLVARTAEQSPDGVAVRVGSEALTYGELILASRRVARTIRDCGAERGDVVLVNHDPGIDYAVAVLGAIIARCHAAPLHPDLPSGRIEAIVRVARPALVLGNPVEGLK